MPPSPSLVARQSIIFSPTSNTEVNSQRLPEAVSLRGMELCYREEPVGEAGKEARLSLWLAVFAILGSLFATLTFLAPSILLRCWAQMEEVEGLPVVGSMLFVMAVLIGLLSLVFLPSAVRMGIAMILLPVGIASCLTWRGCEIPVSIFLVSGSVVVTSLWRKSTKTFHAEWLNADPRVSIANRRQQFSSNGWSFPTSDIAASVLYRVLTYDTQSGAAGVWLAPSSVGLRVILFALLLGIESALFAFAAHVLVPLGLLSGLFALGASILSIGARVIFTLGEITWMSKEQEALLACDSRSAWERHTDRLSNSTHVAADVISGAPIRESEHLFFGVEPWQNFPVLLHRPLLFEHTYMVGRTGAGKTSQGLMQYLIPLIRGYRVSEQVWSKKTPVVIVDLKGDMILFQTAKAEAERRGQTFRFFTPEPGKATHLFNPFSGFRSSRRTVTQLVQLVLDSLSLFYGSAYGKGYYSQRSRFLLSQALRAGAGVNSFQDLYKRLQHLYENQKKDFQDAFQLLSVIESLTHYWQLVTTQAQDADDKADVIRMDRVLEEQEVVYFWLPTSAESATVAEIGKLVLFNLQSAAQDRQAAGKEKRQAFLIIDECQKLAGENFQQVLQQARSAGIAAVLANQSLNDLNTPDWDLRPTIRTNTRVKMFFSINEPEDLKMIEEFSGEELQVYGTEDTEAIRPRTGAKELLSLSDHPKRLLLQVSSGSGYTQFGGLPIPVETDWPISEALSIERANLPWPSSPMPPRIAPVAPSPVVAPSPNKKPIPSTAPAPSTIPVDFGAAKAPPIKKSPAPPKSSPVKVVKPPPTQEAKEVYAKKIQSFFDE